MVSFGGTRGESLLRYNVRSSTEGGLAERCLYTVPLLAGVSE